MICGPCAKAADADQLGIGHIPETCRDHAIQPAGCACRHRPVGSATEHLPVTTTTRED